MGSCEAAIEFGALVGAVIGIAAVALFIVGVLKPKGAWLRGHLLWLAAIAAAWGALHTGAEFAICYAAAASSVSATVIGVTLMIFIAAAASQIGRRSIQ
jgi:hypothetical protein